MAQTPEELTQKMLDFIETCEGEGCDEWYATPRDFAATILTDFAKYMGVELAVPAYVPKKTRVEIDRQALLKELLPHIQTLFNIEFARKVDDAEERLNRGRTFNGTDS